MTKSRTLRKAGAVVLSLAMAFSVAGVAPSADAAAKKPALSAKKGTITIGKTKAVKVKNTTAKKVKKLVVSSNNKKVATVTKKSKVKFIVTGKTAGTAKITAKVTLKKAVAKKKVYKLKYTATVKKAATTPTEAPVVAVTGVTLSNTAPKVGDTVSATITPADATNPSYTWKADGEVIDGATAASFTVTDAQLGKKLTCTVSAGGSSASSAETEAVAAAEVAELKLEAKQTGASTFELKANTVLTNDDAITVTRGTTEQTITKAFGADGKTVVLTTATAITASSYVIKVVPKDTKIKEASVTVTGEKSALKEIKFESDKLVLISNAGSEGTVVVNGYDQFGAKVAISASNTTFYATGATPEYNADTGVLTLTQSGSAFPFSVGSTVAVTVVYQDGATVIQQQATLTVAATAYVKALEFGELATTNKDLAGKKLTISRLADNSYYYPITKAQNQYDQNLTKTDLNNMAKVGTLIISPTNTGYAYIDGFDTLSDGTLIAKVKKGSATTVPTTVPLSLTSVGGGTFTQNLEIADDPYIASLDVSIPETYGNGKVEVSVTAKDQDGADYDFYNGIKIDSDDVDFGDRNHLTNQGSVLDATAGVFTILKDTTNKTVKIYYARQGAIPTKTTDAISVKTAVPTVTSIKVTNNPAGELTKVQGLASGVKTSLKAGESIQLGSGYEKNVVFLDNYGAAMTNAPVDFSGTAPAGANTGVASTSYVYTVSVNNAIDNDGTIDWNTYKGATAATKDLTITLYKVVDNGSNTGDLAVTKVNDVTVKISFAAPTITYKATLTSSENLLYVAATSSDTATIKVERIENGGTPVEITPGSGYTLEDDLGLINSNAIDAENVGNLADGTTGKDNIYVKVAGNIVASVVLDYSNVASAAKSVSWTVTQGGGTVDAADEVTATAGTASVERGVFKSDGYELKVLDQYGLTILKPSLKINGSDIALDASGDATLSTEWVKGGKTNTVVIKSGEVTKTVKITDTKA